MSIRLREDMRPWIFALVAFGAIGAGAFAMQQRKLTARLQASQDSARVVADSLRRADSVRRATAQRDSARQADSAQHALEAATEQSIREMMAPRVTRIADSTFAVPASKFTDIAFARTDSLR